MNGPTAVWTADRIKALGVRTDVRTAGQILGFGRTKAYDLARRGAFPVKVLRVGNQYIVPTGAILAALDVGGTSELSPTIASEDVEGAL